MRKFFLFLLGVQTFSFYAFADELTICTATINSKEERESFQQHLKGENFKFVELTDFQSQVQEKSGNSSQWFENACSAGVKCDVLVISGHYGGRFFSKETNLSLDTDTLEKHSCNSSCDGIIKHPREIFLFGCNTLASRDKDNRTPEQYRQVLLADGIPPDQAEYFVQARYGVLGSSFKERMQRIFTEVPNLYGFDSVGPSGKTVRPFLDRYFQKIPDYHNHLLKISVQKSVDLLQQVQDVTSNLNNKILASVLKNTSFTQCPGMSSEDPAFPLRNEVCELYRADLSLDEKLAIIIGMLEKDNFMLFIPSITNFFKNHRKSLENNPAAKKFLNSTQLRPEILAKLDQLITRLDYSPVLQVELAMIQTMFGAMDKKQFQQKAKYFLRNNLKNLQRIDNLQVLCSLRSDQLEINVDYEDLAPSDLLTPVGIAAFNCLKTNDPRITKKLIEGFKKLSKKEFTALAPTLMLAMENVPETDQELTNLAKKYLSSKVELLPMIAARLVLAKSKSTKDQEDAITMLFSKADGISVLDDYLKKTEEKNDLIAEKAMNKIFLAKDRNPNLLTSIFARVASNQYSKMAEFLAYLEKAPSEVKDSITGQLMSEKFNHPQFGQWLFPQFVKTNFQDPKFGAFIDYFQQVALNQEQINTLVDILKKNTADEVTADLLRKMIKKHQNIALSEDDQRLLSATPL